MIMEYNQACSIRDIIHPTKLKILCAVQIYLKYNIFLGENSNIQLQLFTKEDYLNLSSWREKSFVDTN